MNHFTSLYLKPQDILKPCLVIGKGPSVNYIDKLNLDKYFVVCLNHAGLFFPASISIIIDLEVYTQELVDNCEFLFMPYRSHVNFRPGKILQGMISPWKIYYYDLSTYKGEPVNKPVIRARYNVAEAAFNILGVLGFKTIRSIGIDGGTSYADIFSAKNLQPLTNGQKDFNKQIGEIQKICRKYHIHWKRL